MDGMKNDDRKWNIVALTICNIQTIATRIYFYKQQTNQIFIQQKLHISNDFEKFICKSINQNGHLFSHTLIKTIILWKWI